MDRHDALAQRLASLARDAQHDLARCPEERLRALEEAAQGFRDHDDDAAERALSRLEVRP